MDKQSLRIWAKNKRTELDIEYISKVLSYALISSKEYKLSKNVMIFYPLKDEINLLSLLEDRSKQFYLPRIKDNELECCKYSIGDELCESCFHTKEPTCAPCNISDIDLVIVPALACDKQNYRLGYGGGFYDRFLKSFTGAKICCMPQELIVNTVYPEKHDIKIDRIITESL